MIPQPILNACVLCIVALTFITAPLRAQDTLPPLKNGQPPQTFDQLWSAFDPRAEPLDVEVLKEWQEDGVVLKVLRYRIATFKGRRTMMAAVYGYPKGASRLPGLVQIHGGGQYADYRAPLTNAKRGYATISISWAGRVNAPGYKVTPAEVKLFWDHQVDNPAYRLTTDWGPLDGYHAPCRNPKTSFGKITPTETSLDPVESPRNSGWFLSALGARRALTFLERQPQVDPDRLGVYGHSMGGKLTVMVAGSDSRVKAAAPSCGGVSNRDTGNPLYDATIADTPYLKRITCPIMFLNPSNDFHARFNHLQQAMTEIQSSNWRVTCSPHHNHQDTDNFEVATQIWFDQYLKQDFIIPRTPQTVLNLNTPDGRPRFSVTPDTSKPVLAVEVYYSQQVPLAGESEEHDDAKTRFWHYVAPHPDGKAWTAALDLSTTDRPLWVFANVLYPIGKTITGAGYYYSSYTTSTFNLSSLAAMIQPAQLRAAGLKPTLHPSRVIETFQGDWQKEWFSYNPEQWDRKTYKVHDPLWKAPANARLALDVKTARPNKMVIGIDSFAAEVVLDQPGSWQTITLSASNFQNGSGKTLPDWNNIRQLRLGATDTLKEKINGKNKVTRLGTSWNGPQPRFRSLRWVTGP